MGRRPLPCRALQVNGIATRYRRRPDERISPSSGHARFCTEAAFHACDARGVSFHNRPASFTAKADGSFDAGKALWARAEAKTMPIRPPAARRSRLIVCGENRANTGTNTPLRYLHHRWMTAWEIILLSGFFEADARIAIQQYKERRKLRKGQLPAFFCFFICRCKLPPSDQAAAYRQRVSCGCALHSALV